MQGYFLANFNGRMLFTQIGRMFSADPYVPDTTNTQDYNRYSYARNNPLTYVDPSGFDPCFTNYVERDTYTQGPDQAVYFNPTWSPTGTRTCFDGSGYDLGQLLNAMFWGNSGQGAASTISIPPPPVVRVPEECQNTALSDGGGAPTQTEPTLDPKVLELTPGLGPLVVLGAVIGAVLNGDTPESQRTQPQYVIRGGLAAPDNLIRFSGPVDAPYANLTGFSVTTAPGMSVQQLAMVARYDNGKISYTTTATLASIGVRVVATPFPDRGMPLHATAVVPVPLDPARAAQISAVFTRIPNPAKCGGGG
jgi:RHS repeat-associated protein